MFNQEKKLNRKKNPKEYAHDFRLFGFIWLATILIFLLIVGLLASEKVNFSSSDKFSSFLLTIFLMDILIGIVAFPFTILSGFRYLHTKPKEKLSYKVNHWFKPVLLTALIISFLIVINQATGIVKFAGFEDKVIQPTALSIPLNKQIVDLINNERKKNNRPSLDESNLLIQSATDKIDDMLSKNYWNTNSPDGKTPFSFITKAGYKYDYAGESLIKNFYTAKDIINALLADNINKENILNNNFKEIGIAIKDGFINGQQSKIIVIHYGSVASAMITPQPQDQQQTNQQTNNQQPAITHDGSRTGPIIDYNSYCEKKTIKIYENERIPYKTATGQTVYSTKGDITCYEKDLASTRSVGTTSTTYNTGESTIDCSIDGKAVGKMTYSQCSQAIKDYYQQGQANVPSGTARTTMPSSYQPDYSKFNVDYSPAPITFEPLPKPRNCHWVYYTFDKNEYVCD